MAGSSLSHENLRVAIYARVSTDKQDNENQLLQLREFAAKQGWQIVREYVDSETASKSDRAEFKRMFEDASRRKFDLLVFWALDRLSREGVLETLQHLNRLTSYGVAWRSFTEQFFDSCGPFREAVIAIVAHPRGDRDLTQHQCRRTDQLGVPTVLERAHAITTTQRHSPFPCRH